jgi:hypothetical protein
LLPFFVGDGFHDFSGLFQLVLESVKRALRDAMFGVGFFEPLRGRMVTPALNAARVFSVFSKQHPSTPRSASGELGGSIASTARLYDMIFPFGEAKNHWREDQRVWNARTRT